MADTKNWTWVLERPCPECGFDARTLDRVEIAGATRRVAERFAELLAGNDMAVRARPTPEIWSALEYGAHVRDVFVVMLGRLRLMLREDEPTFANWDQDATAVDEHYETLDPAVVAPDLVAAAHVVADAYAAVADDQWARRGLRSDGSAFTVESLGRYMVHDPVHHVWDVEQGFDRLS
jgi:hypothetical protein